MKTLKLNTLALKIIALVTMFIDHLSYMLHLNKAIDDSTYFVGRAIGRFAFPIYVYLLLVGFYKTKDRKRYGLRLFLFALLSEIPFDYLHIGKWIDYSYQNVFWELLAIFFVYICLDKIDSQKWNLFFKWFVRVVILIGVGFWCKVLGFDYGWFGIAVGFTFYMAYKSYKSKTKFGFKMLLGLGLSLAFFMLENPLELMILWEIPLLLICDTDIKVQQPKIVKFGFYAFYPIHLFILGLLTVGR